MKRPENLKLRHRNISVSYTDENLYLYGHAVSGRMNLFRHVIDVCTGYPESEIADTLVHELAHFIYKDNKLPAKHEERVVSTMADGFTELFLRNPELLAYLTRVAKAHNP